MSIAGFFKKSITVAKVYGIPVRIDYRWFVVVALSVWLISSNLQSNVQLGNVALASAGPGHRLVTRMCSPQPVFFSPYLDTSYLMH